MRENSKGGSAVEGPPKGIVIMGVRARTEIGRIRKEEGVWLAFTKREEGYTPAGHFADFTAALGAIPDQQETVAAPPMPQERKAKGRIGDAPATLEQGSATNRKKAIMSMSPVPPTGQKKRTKGA